MYRINGLHFNNIRGDIYGGLTAGVVALPLAMAMGVASGVGPIAGIYGAIFVGFFAAVLGGTPAQISGPTGPMTVVMAAIFAQYTALFPDNPQYGAALAFTVVMFGGILQIAMGLFKLGRFINFVPHPVVSGFMSGIGLILILLQIGPLLGHPPPSKPLVGAQQIPNYFGQIDLPSLMLGIVTLLIVYGVPKYLPKVNTLVPSALLALIVGTVIYLTLMPTGSTPIIGDIPTGLPDFQMPAIEMTLLLTMLASSLTLAGLGAIDSLLTSLVADKITRTQHQSDRELIGQGIGNTIAGLFGGLPGAGATMRTVVNVKAGGRTPISGTLHALVLLAIVLGAGTLAQDIPKAVLAGVLIKVGTDIIDWDYLKQLKQVPKAGASIMVVVLVVTVVVDLLLAVGIGMVMASWLFMVRTAELQIAGIHADTSAKNATYLNAEEAALLDQGGGAIMVFHLPGPMGFPSAKAIGKQHSQISNYQLMVLDLSQVSIIDFTIAQALKDILSDTLNAKKLVLLVGLDPTVKAMLERLNIIQMIPTKYIHPNRISALQHAIELLATSN